MLDDLLVEGAAELLVALAADAEEFDLLALGHQRLRAFARQTHDRGIEGAGQAALAGADQQQMNLILAGAGEQRRRAGRACRCSAGDVGDHRIHLLGVGRAASAAVCARRSFDAATICIALVIFCVALVEAMRTRMSLSEAILSSPRRSGRSGRTANLSFATPDLVPDINANGRREPAMRTCIKQNVLREAFDDAP